MSSLGGDVIVETVVDEEYGGSHGVLASRLRGYNADLAINSEPTHMAVCPEHRGGREAFLRFTGDAGMAFGGEQQRDPIVALARAITAMRAFDEERNREPTPELYRQRAGVAALLQPDRRGRHHLRRGGGHARRDLPALLGRDVRRHHRGGVRRQLLRQVHEELDAHDDTRGQRATLDRTIRFMPGSSMPLDHPGLGTLRETFDGLPAAGTS